MIFVDTNYFLRFLLRDIDKQHEEAKKLFLEAAAGKIRLITSTIVFFEIYWVLHSYYGKNKEELTKTLSKVLKLSFITLYDREILETTLELFNKNNIELEDCYNLVFIKQNKIKSLKTFDLKLAKKFTQEAGNRR